MDKETLKQFIIQDARTFYACIKANKLYEGMDDNDAIEALDEYFRQRHGAANADSRHGIGRDRYMFFQGMLAGSLVAYKQIKHHIAAEAYNNNRDPITGESFKDVDS